MNQKIIQIHVILLLTGLLRLKDVTLLLALSTLLVLEAVQGITLIKLQSTISRTTKLLETFSTQDKTTAPKGEQQRLIFKLRASFLEKHWIFWKAVHLWQNSPLTGIGMGALDARWPGVILLTAS